MSLRLGGCTWVPILTEALGLAKIAKAGGYFACCGTLKVMEWYCGQKVQMPYTYDDAATFYDSGKEALKKGVIQVLPGSLTFAAVTYALWRTLHAPRDV